MLDAEDKPMGSIAGSIVAGRQLRVDRGTHEFAMIPLFDVATGYLPDGEHRADWRELEQRLGWNAHRRIILRGLLRLASALRDGGCRMLIVDGSFVSAKELPSDFDACCDYTGMCPMLLVGLRLMGSKEVMKAEYMGEVYPHAELVPTDSVYTFREFFRTDRDDIPKGVITLNLASVP